MKRILDRFNNLHSIISALVILALMPGLSPVALVPVAYGQSNLKQPVVSQGALLVLNWTAGTLNNGGHAVTIAAGTTGATASRTDCAAPTYTTCGFLYSNSSGTVSYTTTLATAAASGNVLMAIVESNGTVITKLSFPLQNGALGSVGLGSATFAAPNIGAATGTSLDLTGSLNVGLAGIGAGTVVFENATSGTITVTPPTGALGTVVPTLPAMTGPIPTGYSCGASLAANGACANTAANGTFHMHFGSAVLGSNTSTITGFAPAYTSSTSWWCVANDVTTRANPVQMIPASTTTATITNTTGASDLIQYLCMGV